MTVKAIRHHQSFAGRDADDAHAQYLLLSCNDLDDWDAAFEHSQDTSGNPHSQYLRLAETSEQTMSGHLNLGDKMLTAGRIVGCKTTDLVIRPCEACGGTL